MMSRSIYLVFVVLLNAGCGTLERNQIQITLKSEPSGAMIYEGEKAWGVTPLTLNFNFTEQALLNGYADHAISAVWPSGARKDQTIRFRMDVGTYQHYVFSRPSNVPGLDTDFANAARLQQAGQQSQANQMLMYQMFESMAPKSPTYTNCNVFGSNINCTTR
jgi:uncharacterized protein YceK